jgi:hypothetical protein
MHRLCLGKQNRKDNEMLLGVCTIHRYHGSIWVYIIEANELEEEEIFTAIYNSQWSIVKSLWTEKQYCQVTNFLFISPRHNFLMRQLEVTEFLLTVTCFWRKPMGVGTLKEKL